MSGTQNAKSMTVEVSDAQGQKLATQELTPDSPKWQTKFDKPGEYSFKGVAVNMEGTATTNPCAAKRDHQLPAHLQAVDVLHALRGLCGPAHHL